jgi:hypothetical protein
MKRITKLLKISAFALLITPFSSLSQNLTRGTEAGEIYISTDWYHDGYHLHYGIFYSSDDGENIELKYENIDSPPAGEMTIGFILGDAMPGVLYNDVLNELWVSYNYGKDWECNELYGESRFASGCIPGEIYRCCNNPEGTIWRSTDFGSQFIEIRNNAKYILEVGVNESVLYGIDGSSGEGFIIHYSKNYGLDFITIPIDSSVASWQIGGYYPEISRGTESGELYLVSWWPGYHYKIFHSVDTGYTWSEKFESGYIDTYFWRVKYTAGRAPGSFYMVRITVDPESHNHNLLYIDYSSDYGQTFTTYFHELDSTVGINKTSPDSFSINALPNPFNQNTTFEIKLPEQAVNTRLQIFDLYGNMINEFDVSGKDKIVWDGTDRYGQTVACGLYLYKISSGDYQSPLNKLIFLNR